ncbi:MAG TPA: hypothetical protein VI362_03895 [Ignavibacteriaceae bacterium]|nr:hypothetical protein [Ignavibacteriaceae bacterium]
MAHKYTPALICGFGAAVISTIPGIRNIACCLVVPLSAIIAIYLNKKTTQDVLKIPTGTGLMIGLLTGIFAALFTSLFDIMVTYLTRTNDFISSLPESKEIIKSWNLGTLVEESMKLMESMATEIKSSGFSILYAVMITISNLLTHSVFGFLGGALGVAVINKRKT